ncbi:unnamed protein product [Hymenolepis diminuta]|uniref:Uncharacterized protein n=1 Tax=Hymenolepis diminuta TaxID=6216 RepID=A0A564Z6F0_HYMDI|nr:unnamed protein product [Hymenolepis diminuta]
MICACKYNGAANEGLSNTLIASASHFNWLRNNDFAILKEGPWQVGVSFHSHRIKLRFFNGLKRNFQCLRRNALFKYLKRDE